MMRATCALLVIVGCSNAPMMPGDTGDDGGKADDGDASTDAGVEPDPDGDVDGNTGRPTIWQPPPGTSWQWQLTGTINTSFDVDMYDIDLFDAPTSKIAELHAAGRIVICYFSAGSYENWRPDANQFPASALGNNLDGWPGERWLDTRSTAVRNIMKARLDLAAQRGCDGVEPDNIDGYTNGSGFALTAATQINYNRFLATEAHARNLSIGLKNDLDQVTQLVGDFDWALNEQCFEYDECELLEPFINAGKAVFEVEYGGQTLANSICPTANSMNFDTLVKRLDLDATRISCR
ncbi:MAG TPA: endo alpha-1,4 polygalactosaminidase [Kofleriaceae bacterium]